MREADFISTRFGHLTRSPTSTFPHKYFLPEPIPRELTLDDKTVIAISEANLALGRLDGVSDLIRDPALLLGPSMAQEALSSSRIEGTQASLSDVLSAESSAEAIEDENLREVDNYLRSAKQGRELLETWPLTQRFFCALHETLMRGVRGDEKFPGEIRNSPVWIGAVHARPETAKFIPPIQDHLGELLTDWEKFVNAENTRLPMVVKCALMHYQFETIHPFLDGNGRIGRLLIGFSLMQDRVLQTPILHISGYFERNRQEYYDRLQAVRERGEVNEWIRFFSNAISAQANESAHRIRSLVGIRERYRRTAERDRSRLSSLIDVIFTNPVVTVDSVRRALEIAQPTTSVLLRKAESNGWLRSIGRWGKGGKERWLAFEVWNAVASPLDLEMLDAQHRS